MANETLTVTADMTIQTLIDAGIVTLAQLQSYANAKAAGGRGGSNPDRAAFAQEVFQIMLEQPQLEWKNGKVLKTWFPNGKETDVELEKLRVKKHGAISRALADLVKDGMIVKDRKGSSASGTFYKVADAHIPAPETDDSGEGEELELLVPEAQDNVIDLEENDSYEEDEA